MIWPCTLYAMVPVPSIGDVVVPSPSVTDWGLLLLLLKSMKRDFSLHMWLVAPLSTTKRNCLELVEMGDLGQGEEVL